MMRPNPPPKTLTLTPPSMTGDRGPIMPRLIGGTSWMCFYLSWANRWTRNRVKQWVVAGRSELYGQPAWNGERILHVVAAVQRPNLLGRLWNNLENATIE